MGDKSKLEMHLKSVHDKIKDFECKYCGQRFSQKSKLKRHQIEYHLDAKDETIKKEVSFPESKILKAELILEEPEPRPIIFDLITDFKLEVTDDLRPELVSHVT